jgi:hypothetical protein
MRPNPVAQAFVSAGGIRDWKSPSPAPRSLRLAAKETKEREKDPVRVQNSV